MSRKLYPGEARKVRAMLGEDFTDIEISRALHVAQSTVSKLRDKEQIDAEKTDSESLKETKEEEISSEITDKETTSIDNPKSEPIDDEIEGITFVGGRSMPKEEPIEEDFVHNECGAKILKGQKFCTGCGEELNWD